MSEFDTKRYFDSKGKIKPEAFGLLHRCTKCGAPTRFEDCLCGICTLKLAAEVDEHEIGGIG